MYIVAAARVMLRCYSMRTTELMRKVRRELRAWRKNDWHHPVIMMLHDFNLNLVQHLKEVSDLQLQELLPPVALRAGKTEGAALEHEVQRGNNCSNDTEGTSRCSIEK
jgi:hypothetical protein